jgi:hypothetical protein
MLFHGSYKYTRRHERKNKTFCTFSRSARKRRSHVKIDVRVQLILLNASIIASCVVPVEFHWVLRTTHTTHNIYTFVRVVRFCACVRIRIPIPVYDFSHRNKDTADRTYYICLHFAHHRITYLYLFIINVHKQLYFCLSSRSFHARQFCCKCYYFLYHTRARANIWTGVFGPSVPASAPPRASKTQHRTRAC